MQSEEGIEFRLRYVGAVGYSSKPALLAVLNEDEAGTTPDWLKSVAAEGQLVVLCEPRGIGATKWTRKNPPNYVERSHALLGRTVDAGRVWDIIAAAKYLAAEFADGKRPITVAGKGPAAILAAYAAAIEEQIVGAKLVSPPATHMVAEAPQFLNILRVCDAPDALGLLAPRPLSIIGAAGDDFARTKAIYDSAEAGRQLTTK